MIRFTLSHASVMESAARAKVFFVQQDAQDAPHIYDIAQKYMSNIQDIFTQYNFTGQLSKIVAIPVSHQGKYSTLYFVGLGKVKGTNTIENYRRALGSLMKTLQRNKEASSCFEIPNPDLFNVSYYDIAKETAIIGNMALYQFNEYITDTKSHLSEDMALEIIIPGSAQAQVQKGLDEGTIIAQSVNQARHWIDLPPCRLTPSYLAHEAEKLGKKQGLKVTIFDEPTIKKMGMGGLEAVSSGSDQDCRFVIMEYASKQKDAPTIALVGKGITFDSGGLNLKPRGYIENMKEDMSGAAAVISTMIALAQLKPSVNVIGIAPISENLPSGKSAKPGDIIKFYNGKTAEIQDTDAEGRLILADALSYAVKHYTPDAIIDIATLTGACAYALGPFFTGLMSQHDDMKTRLENAAGSTGDRVWELPLHDDYKPAIKSQVADLANVGGKKYLAGAITAAAFLQNFVDDTPWAHLDIAGTAFDVPDISYFTPGLATGAGIRLMISVIQSW